ncbi:beta-glucosidase A [Blastomyces gilchristii SLH14081]|uniref:beta-glucosidase n=1 Tax=Blastomyces gilchristii (strain SLH14081) TaxID=559298 RepID=A0A179UNI7_BLAGS|nr:beta-glucosidase A [Blastomyces gilchristii SLH14081]OAT08789.1 beta-glucosidase A [Blastomyces gilchristii SLH14081]
MRGGLLQLAAVATTSLVVAEEPLAYSPPYYPSPWASGEGGWEDAVQRARAFVSQLTLPEKVNLTTGVGWMQEDCVGQVGSIPRMGLHSLCLQDGPLGIRFADYVSAFPAGVNVGATFSKELAYIRGRVMGEEHRNKGVDIVLGPAIGPLGRSPDGGRNWEGFGPDPVNSGILVAQTIQGIQSAGVVACAKHFIGNEQERFRQGPEAQGYGFNISESSSSNIDDVTMHELYLWPFADAVRAGVGSVMCSYTQINNSYGCGNSYTQNKLLKAELGFQGFIMSDWQAQHSGVGSALAGLDMSMPGDTVFGTGLSYWGTNLTIAVANGTIPEWRVDDMAVRIMAAYYKVGRDTAKVPTNFNSWTRDEYGYQHALVREGYGKVNERVNVRARHANIIRQVGAASVVLLKNTGSLPLTGLEKTTAVIGEDAGPNLLGPNGCPDRGCDKGTLAMGWGSGTADFPYLVTPAEAIQNEILYKGEGVVLSIFDNWASSQIKSLASQATVSLVFVNADSGEGYISVDGNEGDRKNLTLWNGGDELIDTVASNCNNTVVVIHSTGPVLVGDWNEHPNITALLWAGLPGQESGNSIADVLYGRVNPGAKTPFTWGKTAEDYGASILKHPNAGNGAPQVDFTEGIFIDYRAFDKANIDPIYEFGFGLSYTSFSYSGLAVEVVKCRPYIPTEGKTESAPSFGESHGNLSSYLFPEGIDRVTRYIYPWLNTTDPAKASMDPDYGQPTEDYVPPGATDGSPQELLPAGGGPGGNPGLYDVLYEVTATITNTGTILGDEVPQLYVSLGGPNDAKVVLRTFDRFTFAPGEAKVWKTALTRRDLSNWDPVSQNWVITKHPKTVYVGSSSRNLPLSAPLSSNDC